MRTSKQITILCLIIACIINGINAPVIHFGLQTIPVALFGFLRMLIPFIILTPFIWLTQRKRLKTAYLLRAVTFGVIIYVISNGLFYLGIQRSGTINAAIIGLLEPLIMFTFSVKIMREKFNGRLLSGIGIAFMGSLLIVFGPLLLTNQGGVDFNIIGNLLLLLVVLSNVSGNWVAKLGLKQIDQLQLLYWALLPGVIMYGILSFPQWPQVTAILAEPSLVAVVLFGAIGNGLIGYLLSLYALKRLKGGEYGVFGYIVPAVAAFVAVIVFGERFTSFMLLGVSIIFIGLFMVERHKYTRNRAKSHVLRSR